MEKLNDCFDEAEKRKIQSEDPNEKDMIEVCYEVSKRILNQITQQFGYFTWKLDENLQVLE